MKNKKSKLLININFPSYFNFNKFHFSNINSFWKISNNKTGFDKKIYLMNNNNTNKEIQEKKSFLHDISYKNNDNEDTYNMVYEIGYGETAKMEMSKEEFNPIIQDTKKDKISGKYLRYYKIPPLFNYGFIPQTWESNKVKHRNLYIGDNDPIDVIELSLPNKNIIISNENKEIKENLNLINNNRISSGKITRIHVLGSFCLLDQNEIDWKIFALNADIFSKEESENYFNNEKNQIRIKEIMNWFKIYKTYEGKKENIILDNDKIFTRNETIEIIKENHIYYLYSFIEK
jgi:inorganic pyrophosphatase